MSRSNYLFIAAVFSIGLFFSIPLYFNWLSGFILRPPSGYANQFQHLDPEERRSLRYGNSYNIYMRAITVFQRANILDPVILLPPVGYFTKNGSFNVESVEPSEFYYFTGYKAVFATSTDVDMATWALVPGKTETGAMLRRIHTKEDRDTLIKKYLQFKPGK